MIAFTSLAVLALAALRASAQLVVSTPPSLTLCQKANFQVTGWSGQGSLYAVVVKASDPCGDALKEIDVTGSFDWTVDVPAGETVMLAIEDKDGNEAWTGALKIQPGDSSCVASSTSSRSAAPTSSARVNNGVANAAAPTDSDAPSSASRPMVAGAAFAGLVAAIAALAL